MKHSFQGRLLSDSQLLTASIQDALRRFAQNHHLAGDIAASAGRSSAVLFLIGDCPCREDQRPEPCLILNKRSNKVRQPGDLCFPGGGLAPLKDRLIAAALGVWPWSCKSHVNHLDPGHAKIFRLHLAAALREAWEEMRLNPFKARCLGYLPIQHLRFVDRRIWPVVARISGQHKFKSNWEVVRIVPIALAHLLDPDRYARFRPSLYFREKDNSRIVDSDGFRCFVHQDSIGRELLWGATFRMVVDFLRIVFNFQVPESKDLPEVEGDLAPGYPKGNTIPSR